MNISTITVAQSNAFVTTFDLSPTDSGPLDGLRFAVKDTIDVAGFKTGCGNPTWRDSHPAAVVHAVCVEQLLRAGARCVGKTISDELAFSLLGENHFYGTPLNAHAPDRVPGGSSRLHADWWILRWERIRAVLPAFPRAIVESGASGHRMISYRLLA
jgi:amidase